MRLFAKQRLAGAAALFLFASTSLGVVYVDASKAGGNGTSWSQAYRTIEAAVTASPVNSEYWIVAGTYRPSSTITITKGGQLFYGGFNGTETQLSQRNPGANQVIVDGQNALKHVFFINVNGSGCILDGLTITRGRANGGPGWDTFGGGVFVDTQPATIANCVFSDNSSSYMAGGLMINRSASVVLSCVFQNNSSPLGGGLSGYDADITVQGCSFSGNTAPAGSGGAIWIFQKSPDILNCNFANNTASQGGAVHLNNALGLLQNCNFTNNTVSGAGGAVAYMLSTGTVSKCTFKGNTCNDNGGGVFAYYSPITVSESTFYQNSAQGGGGVQLDYRAPIASTIDRCVFIANNGGFSGGGLSSYAQSMLVQNCIFDGNAAANGGGIVTHAGNGGDYDPGYNIIIRNCVLVANTATDYGGGMVNSYAPSVSLQNSIFWGNSASSLLWDPNLGIFVTSKDIFNASSSSMNTRHCNIESLNWIHASVSESHTGSFTNNPRFVDTNGADDVQGTLDDDFRLQTNSPCVDRGDGNNAVSQDIVFTARFDLLAVANTGIGSPNYTDIGAYEIIQYAATPTFAPVGGTFTSFFNVAISCATPGATIRYTTDGSTPTASSPAGTTVAILYSTTLKARAYASGFAESAEGSASYTMTDADADGLPNWVETGTGVYANPTNTGTSPTIADTDGDGFNDGLEVQRGSDPNDPSSKPVIVKNDFDGDGRTDLGCYFPPGGNWYFMKTRDGFSVAQFGFDGTLPVNGDFDGDGKSDYGCYYPPSGNWYFMKTTDEFSINQFGFGGTLPITGDFDGDGKTDYGCYYPPSGNWYMMQSTAGFIVAQFGFGGTLPITGDFDGDGRTDYGCYYPPSGNWYMMQSTAGFVINQFGFGGTLPITGDFDGDGKTDYGCYYAPSGNWYMMQSTAGFVVAQFGFGGTEPITGDYDGDGRTDYGCYYAPGGNWYIMQSTAGFAVSQFGYGGTIPLGKDVVGN
ncbi:MAG: chitobiase/beta-hexosaminidase C-terminal domain-containing protein [bacterium]